MAEDAHEEHRRQLAEEDPTLIRLTAALEEERRWQAMTTAGLLAVVEQLEAKFRTQGEHPLGTV